VCSKLGAVCGCLTWKCQSKFTSPHLTSAKTTFWRVFLFLRGRRKLRGEAMYNLTRRNTLKKRWWIGHILLMYHLYNGLGINSCFFRVMYYKKKKRLKCIVYIYYFF
jgi:hypothetical protein